MHEESPPEEQDREFILIEENVTDLGSQSSRLKNMIIKEKEAEIQALSLNLERAKWIINFIEQENKQMTDKQAIMELQMIREDKREVKKTKIKLTSLEQEIENDLETSLERVNIHLEKLLEKANKEKRMLHHMAYHYLTWNKICKTRVKRLKAKLRRALRPRKNMINSKSWLKLH